MKFEFDYKKSEKNESERGISFSQAEDFEFETARYEIDARKEYGEIRFAALGLIKGRLHSLVFTERGDSIRIISLRKAGNREKKIYEEYRKN